VSGRLAVRTHGDEVISDTGDVASVEGHGWTGRPGGVNPALRLEDRVLRAATVRLFVEELVVLSVTAAVQRNGARLLGGAQVPTPFLVVAGGGRSGRALMPGPVAVADQGGRGRGRSLRTPHRPPHQPGLRPIRARALPLGVVDEERGAGRVRRATGRDDG